MKKRPVVRSDGIEYESLSAAARDLELHGVASLHRAMQITMLGHYQAVKGFQFAYKDQKPEEWPEKQSQQKPQQKPQQKIELTPISAQDTKDTWRLIHGIPGYEVSIYGDVRAGSTTVLQKKWMGFSRSIPVVKIDDRLYRVCELVMQTFCGPKPYGFDLVRLEGLSSALSNLVYVPTKRGKHSECAKIRAEDM